MSCISAPCRATPEKGISGSFPSLPHPREWESFFFEENFSSCICLFWIEVIPFSSVWLPHAMTLHPDTAYGQYRCTACSVCNLYKPSVAQGLPPQGQCHAMQRGFGSHTPRLERDRETASNADMLAGAAEGMMSTHGGQRVDDRLPTYRFDICKLYTMCMHRIACAPLVADVESGALTGCTDSHRIGSTSVS